MPKKEPKEAGTAYLEQLLAKIPEAKRAEIKAVLSDEAVVLELGNGVLAQAEFSRLAAEAQENMQSAKTWHENLNKWWTEKQDEIVELRAKAEKLEAAGDAEGAAAARGAADDATARAAAAKPQALPADIVRKAELDSVVSTVLSQGGQLVATITDAAFSHFQEFNEKLDTPGLLAFCRERGLAINNGGYDAFVAERRKTHEKKKHDDEIKAAEKRGRESRDQELAHGRTDPGPPSFVGTLAGLNKESKSKFGVEAAVERFNRNRQAT